MNAENTLHVECYSEITHDSIGCGVLVPNQHPSTSDIDIYEIIELLGESFWELLDSFESSAQQAFDNGEISGTQLDDLFKVFGHFRFSCTVNNDLIDIDLGFDPDEYIYPLLVEYLEINTNSVLG